MVADELFLMTYFNSFVEDITHTSLEHNLILTIASMQDVNASKVDVVGFDATGAQVIIMLLVSQASLLRVVNNL